MANVNEVESNPKILDANEIPNAQLNKTLKNNTTIKGIIDTIFKGEDSKCNRVNSKGKLVAKRFENIEMICVDQVFPDFHLMCHPEKVKQLFVQVSSPAEAIYLSSKFNNLMRLHISDLRDIDDPKNKATFPNLKILEIMFDEIHSCSAYHLLDRCPSLESAYICHDDRRQHPIKDSVKNLNLKNLVIANWMEEGQFWSSIRKILRKFPNLENLAIRGNCDLNDKNIKQIITLCPRIKLMDFRATPGVTEKSEDFLQKSNKRSKRSIVIYYGDESESSDWPQIDHSCKKICSGFDFMKNCFYKDFHELPYFLDS